jgi:hypothetical protein
MVRKISRYTIATVISLLTLCPASEASAQQRYANPTPKRDQVKQPKQVAEEAPLFNGMYLGVDIFGIGNKLLGGDMMSSDVSLTVNLKNKFLPTIEAGMGKTDATSDEGINFKSTSPYFKIGADYNFMAKKVQKNGYLYGGLRYCFSPVKFDVATVTADGDTPPLQDYVWGSTEVPYNHPGQKVNMQWLEFVLGVRVKIVSNFMMGWSVRMKYRTSASDNEYGVPYMVPGFGKYGSNTLGVTYNLIYRIPGAKAKGAKGAKAPRVKGKE